MTEKTSYYRNQIQPLIDRYNKQKFTSYPAGMKMIMSDMETNFMSIDGLTMEAIMLLLEYGDNSCAGPDGKREFIKYLKKKIRDRKKFEEKLKAVEAE